jgi:O-acetyl-ADP-ribose deacetylase (regulator of RNase III)
MTKIIKQNILEINSPGVICHQVNCKRVMGSGLALQIRNKWDFVYDAYMNKDDWSLGNCQIVAVSKDLYVANLAGQNGYGKTGCHTDIRGLGAALLQANLFALKNKIPIYIPYMIGCGLGGGDWDEVLEMIEKISPDAIICKLGT